MAAAISCMRALPGGMRSTRKMRTMAKMTAAAPPATAYKAAVELSSEVTRAKRLMEGQTSTSEPGRVRGRSGEDPAPPPHRDAGHDDDARHQNGGDEDDVALV